LGVHSSGNLVTTKIDDHHILLIDGQQRMTTSSLLIAALRDALLSEGADEQRDKTVCQLNNALYLKENWRDLWETEKEFGDGEDATFCRLLPSFDDRKAFFTAITKGVKEGDKSDSLQSRARHIFDRSIKNYLDQKCGQNSTLRREELCIVARLALDKMGAMKVDLEDSSEADARSVASVLPQIFLWLQEKTLFSEGALLFNPSPGIGFASADLVRNLLLAPAVLALPELNQQETFYRDQWLSPVEHPGGQELSKALKDFAVVRAGPNGRRHISQLELSVAKIRERFPVGKGVSVDHASVYARFFSFYEGRLRSAAMLPPKTVAPKAKETKKKAYEMHVTAKKKEESKEEEEELDLDADVVRMVSEKVLKEFAEFISNDFKRNGGSRSE